MDINCFLSRNIHMGAIKHSELVEFGRICCEGILQLFIVYISILGNNNISNDLWNCCNPLGVILDCSRTTKCKKNKDKGSPIPHPLCFYLFSKFRKGSIQHSFKQTIYIYHGTRKTLSSS